MEWIIGNGLPSCSQSERVCTELTHADGLAQVKLEDGHLVRCTLFTEKTTTVTTRMSVERERERERLDDNVNVLLISVSYCLGAIPMYITILI